MTCKGTVGKTNTSPASICYVDSLPSIGDSEYNVIYYVQSGDNKGMSFVKNIYGNGFQSTSDLRLPNYGLLLNSSNSKNGLISNKNMNRIFCFGDSLISDSFSDTLSKLLPNYEIVNAGIGGENFENGADRAEAAKITYPIKGTDTITAGTVTIKAEPYSSTFYSDASRSGKWATYRESNPNPTAVALYNQGTFIGYAEQLVNPVTVDISASTTQINLFKETKEDVEWLANGSNEDAVMSTTFLDGLIKSRVSSPAIGGFSAKFENDSAIQKLRYLRLYGTSLNRVWEVRGKIFIPSGNDSNWAMQTRFGTLAPITTQGEWVDFRDFITNRSQLEIELFPSTAPAPSVGEAAYLDSVTIRRSHELDTTSNYEVGDQVWFTQWGIQGFPAALSENRAYFIVSKSGSTIEVSETLGGAAITFAADAKFIMHGHYEYNWTATTADVNNYDIQVSPREARDGIYIFWFQNGPDVDTNLNDVRRMVATLGDDARYIIMGPIRSTATKLTSTGYNENIIIHRQLEDEFGDRYFDPTLIVQQLQDGSAQDLNDVGRDITPDSTRYDGIHLTDPATIYLVENGLYLRAKALGWV